MPNTLNNPLLKSGLSILFIFSGIGGKKKKREGFSAYALNYAMPSGRPILSTALLNYWRLQAQPEKTIQIADITQCVPGQGIQAAISSP